MRLGNPAFSRNGHEPCNRIKTLGERTAVGPTAADEKYHHRKAGTTKPIPKAHDKAQRNFWLLQKNIQLLVHKENSIILYP